MNDIPFLSVSGSHFECGKQIGSHFKSLIEHYLALCRSDPPENLSWSACLAHSQSFLEPTQKYFPEIIDEIKGVAEGSETDFTELFTSCIEELYSKHFHLKDCTDIIMLPPASNHTLVAHNNDLPPNIYDVLTSVEWNFADGSRMFTVGLAGFLVSVGVNDSGLVLSGNELTPTDTRVGIPRGLIARAILSAKNIDDAVKIAIHPARASSYNNILTVKGQTIDVEASATEYDFLFPKNGLLTHSNHYCSPKLLPFEGKPNYESSLKRLESASAVAGHADKVVDLKTIESFLQSHGPDGLKSDNTVCRHGERSATIFGFAVDLDDRVAELSSGHPCENPFKTVWRY